MRSGRVGFTRIWMRFAAPAPLSVSPMIQRTVSPAATGPEPTSCLAGLERDVGDLARRGVDLIERAGGEGIDLDRVEIVGARRLDARGAVRLVDAHMRIGRFRAAACEPGSGFSWPGNGSSFGSSTICTGFGGLGSSTASPRRVVIADLGRLPGGCACAERNGRQQQGCKRQRSASAELL